MLSDEADLFSFFLLTIPDLEQPEQPENRLMIIRNIIRITGWTIFFLTPDITLILLE
jgi:hypothetical protein